MNRSLSLSLAKMTEKIAIFVKPNLEVQIFLRVCLEGLYVHPIEFFRPEILFYTSPASFDVCSSFKLGVHPPTCTPHGRAASHNP